MTDKTDTNPAAASPEKPAEPSAQSAQAASDMVLLEKWFDVSLDTDRQLLTLSTAAIGLLATLLTSKGVSSTAQLFLIVFSGLSFFLVIAVLLCVFQQNKAILHDTIMKKKVDESALKILDATARIGFCSGVCLLSLFAVFIAIEDLDESNAKKLKEQLHEQGKSTNSQKYYPHASPEVAGFGASGQQRIRADSTAAADAASQAFGGHSNTADASATVGSRIKLRPDVSTELRQQ